MLTLPLFYVYLPIKVIDPAYLKIWYYVFFERFWSVPVLLMSFFYNGSIFSL